MSKETTEDKIDKIWKISRTYSAEASKISRQLAFGEGAIFWMFFREPDKLSNLILIGLVFLVLYFVFDILQYFIGSFINKNLAVTYEENKENLNPSDIERPKSLNDPVYLFYYLKFVMLLVASLLLISMFISKWVG